MTKAIKTEHCGAKNGGGFWGMRKEAKILSTKKRRMNKKQELISAKREIEHLVQS